MTKRLQDLFELPPDQDIMDNDTDLLEPVPDCEEITQTALTNLEKIEAALPKIRGLEEADKELDELAELAVNSFKDLSELGLQVESRFSSEIFSAAGTMLGHAITARTAKVNKKLKQLDLLLKKEALEQKLLKDADKEKDVDNTPLGEGQSLDRNELLKLLSEKNNHKDK
jgi:hypothetical protein